MNQDEIRDNLVSSAQRWAQTSIDAYLEDPADQDFAVHHMAVAVEHIAKAYLASVALSLLAPIKPSVNDLLVLGGQEDMAVKGRAGLKSIGGEEAVKRAGEVLENRQLPDHLNALREARNSITHMGWGRPSSECRTLVASGVTYIGSLLPTLAKDPEWFWGHWFEASKSLVAEATSELELRYNAKLRRARDTFAKTTKHLSQSDKAAVIASLSSVPLSNRWPLHIPTPCPACQSPAFVSGRDKSGEYGAIWFFPRHFGCRVCGLTLTGQELALAGIEAQTLNEEPEIDPDWEPDFDLM